MNEIKIKSSIRLQNNELHDVVAVVNLSDNELLKNKNFRLKVKGKAKKRINNTNFKEYHEEKDILNKSIDQDINISDEFKTFISKYLKNSKGVKFYGKIKKVNDRKKHSLKHSQSNPIKHSTSDLRQEKINNKLLGKINNICLKGGNQINISSFLRIKKKAIQKEKKNIKKCVRNKLVANLKEVTKREVADKKKESNVIYNLKERKYVNDKKETKKSGKTNRCPLSIRLNYEKNKLYFNCLFKNIKNKDSKVLNDMETVNEQKRETKSVCEIEEFVKNNKYIMKENIKNIYSKKKDSDLYSCNTSVRSRKDSNGKNKRNSGHKYEETYMSLSDDSERGSRFENEGLDKDISCVHPLQGIEKGRKQSIKHDQIVNAHANVRGLPLLNDKKDVEANRGSQLDSSNLEKQSMSLFLKFPPFINKKQISKNSILCYKMSEHIDINNIKKNNIEIVKYNTKRESVISIHSMISRNGSISEIDEDSKYYSNYNFEKKNKLSFINKLDDGSIFKMNPNKIGNYKIEKKTKSLSVVNTLNGKQICIEEKNKIKKNSINFDKKLLSLNMSNILGKKKEMNLLNPKLSNNFVGSRNRSGPIICKRTSNIKSKNSDVKLGKNKINETKAEIVDKVDQIKSGNENVGKNNLALKNVNINDKPEEKKAEDSLGGKSAKEEVTKSEMKEGEVKESAEPTPSEQNANIKTSENNETPAKLEPKASKPASKSVVIKTLAKKLESKICVKQNASELKKKAEEEKEEKEEKGEGNNDGKDGDSKLGDDKKNEVAVAKNNINKMVMKKMMPKMPKLNKSMVKKSVTLKAEKKESCDTEKVDKDSKKVEENVSEPNSQKGGDQNGESEEKKKSEVDETPLSKPKLEAEKSDGEQKVEIHKEICLKKNVKNIPSLKDLKKEKDKNGLNKTDNNNINERKFIENAVKKNIEKMLEKEEVEKDEEAGKTWTAPDLSLFNTSETISKIMNLNLFSPTQEGNKSEIVENNQNNCSPVNQENINDTAESSIILKSDEKEKEKESGEPNMNKAADLPPKGQGQNASKVASKIGISKKFAPKFPLKSGKNGVFKAKAEAVKKVEEVEKVEKKDDEKKVEAAEKAEEKKVEAVEKAEEKKVEAVEKAEEKKVEAVEKAEEKKVEAVEKAEEKKVVVEKADEKKAEAVEKTEEKVDEKKADEKKVEGETENNKPDNLAAKKPNILKHPLKAKMGLPKNNVEKVLIKKNNFIKKLNSLKNISTLKELPVKNDNNENQNKGDTKNMNENIKIDENKNDDTQLNSDSIKTDNTSVVESSGNLDTPTCLTNDSVKAADSVNKQDEQIKNDSSNEEKKTNENINNVPSKPVIKIVPKFPKNVVSGPTKANLTKNAGLLNKIAKTKPPMLSKFKSKAA
ncbi:conserved Plasmodium protein, unknown function [Plasmodium chabaudi chabaudi]|uniref:Uncharacterized protein n=1 Tax=Plasmodium chabaudi chabaudi TaxID=31271 RepID=A0A4V0K3G2_PLACU|nr:conserved Plasmodium protein, unknown function [Plasmodium chabaudi chabaudi]VTZ67446.1 conserved Plasmodium protein, unknown function [Plasmodium chabaudi chabaudi]|eukprot:XP_741539.2 conserved Plasmodium protein, unknown function [Plasmodium chabaudi chabaudi]